VSDGRLKVLIAGGGIAGLELLTALDDLAPDKVDVTIAAPDREFVYKPLLVKEPFTSTPPSQIELDGIAGKLGATYVHAALESVDPEAHTAGLSNGAEIAYDVAAICVGAKLSEALAGVTTLYGFADHIPVNELIEQASAHPSKRLGFVVPPGVTWPLPLYEAALMAASRARELGHEVEIVIYTPEHSPLSAFGRIASQAVDQMLARRGIKHECDCYLSQEEDGTIVHGRHGEPIEAGAIVALPVLSGREIAGLPSDPDGFIPIDVHGRVRGVEDVYAAGDGANFPVKQGGIGAQQADAVAESIAARVGAIDEPTPFSPVLRGKLLTGEESLNLKADLAGGRGESVASHDYLWWPPQKVAGRYLSAWLAGVPPREDPEPPEMTVDVEVSLPSEWHGDPIGF
jgi:sulfide:quinone oxidoreductase